jgi:cysteine desulfurase
MPPFPRSDYATTWPIDTIYLDHHATTPVHREVWHHMSVYADAQFHNPSGMHAGSLAVQAMIDSARQSVLRYLNAPRHQTVFTSGATEANNLALQCFGGPSDGRRTVLLSPTEHKSVLATAGYLHEQRALQPTFLKVDRVGHVDLDDLRGKLSRGGVSMVSVMAVNNEIGTIAHLPEISTLCQEHDALFHCDATQAMDTVRLDLSRLAIDLLSFSAHKIYGPKGVGCLVVSAQALDRFTGPLLHGGGQQGGLRPGTENVPGIAGLHKAIELCERGFDAHLAHRSALRDRLQAGLQSHFDLTVNGDPARRHPANLHVSFRDVQPQRFFARCDRIAFSTGSACNSQSGEASHVLRAIRLDPGAIKASMRLSVGLRTTESQVEQAIAVFLAARDTIPA